MDNKELNNQLYIQQQNITRLKKLYSMLADAENYRNMLIRKCNGLKTELEKENVDLLKLEGKSFSSLVYIVLGTLDKHMEKEKSEALAAKLKYDQAQNDLQHINDRIDTLNAERDTYSGCQHKYDELYTLKKHSLLVQNGREAELILELDKNIGAAKISLKEIVEAKSAGKTAYEALSLALEKLDSAEDYGFWDIGGGGMIASAMKHDYIDDATEYIAQAQDRIERFKEELGDVDLNVQMSDGLYLTDVLFDNIITDFIMQSRINKIQSSVNEAMEKVKQALITLDWMESEKKNELDGFNDNLKQLITYG